MSKTPFFFQLAALLALVTALNIQLMATYICEEMNYDNEAIIISSMYHPYWSVKPDTKAFINENILDTFIPTGTILCIQYRYAYTTVCIIYEGSSRPLDVAAI